MREDGYRVMGIDPGVNGFGVSVLEYCEGEPIKLIHVETIKGERLLTGNDYLIDTLGKRHAKLYLLEQELKKRFFKLDPHEVISEAPYLGRFANAFAGLIECIYMIRRTLYSFNPSMLLVTIDPPTIKNAIGVRGGSKDKLDMTKALIKLESEHKLIDLNGINPNDLDEHSVDATAIAYTQLSDELGYIPLEVPKNTAVKKKRRKKRRRR